MFKERLTELKCIRKSRVLLEAMPMEALTE
jgi:hypothetical protein